MCTNPESETGRAHPDKWEVGDNSLLSVTHILSVDYSGKCEEVTGLCLMHCVGVCVCVSTCGLVNSCPMCGTYVCMQEAVKQMVSGSISGLDEEGNCSSRKSV